MEGNKAREMGRSQTMAVYRDPHGLSKKLGFLTEGKIMYINVYNIILTFSNI